MKKHIQKILIYSLILLGLSAINVSIAGFGLGNDDDNIINTDINHVIDTSINGGEISDPIRDGAYYMINPNGNNGLQGIVGSNDVKISNSNEALNKVLKIIQNIINYALALVSLVALIYLIIHGFFIITASGDDSKYKKGMKGMKNAAIALSGIGLSRLFISFLFRLIKEFSGN